MSAFFIHQTTTSKVLLNALSSLGFSATYEQVTAFGKSVVLCESIEDLTDDGGGFCRRMANNRRLRGYQIEVLKILNGYEDVDWNMFFKLKEGSRTRGHKAALVKEQCRLDMRKYSFSQRVINEWNKLPNDCVNASSVNMIKNRIDIYLIRAGYT